MINISQLEPSSLATLSAIVAAVVAVSGDAFNLPKRFRALVAIGLAILLVFLPQTILNKVLTACIIGITASGVYSQIKPSKLFGITKKITSQEPEQKNTRTKPENTNNQQNSRATPSYRKIQKKNE